MHYGDLVAVFEDLAGTSSRIEKTERLATLLESAEAELLGPVLLLTRGRVFERWESGELGVSSALTREAIGRATGTSEDWVEDRWRDRGDLGSAAAEAVESNRQATIASRPLTVRRVYDDLRSLADLAGEGSRDRRVGELAGLISDATPTEAKYLVRTAGGAMRLGVGEGIVRDAIASAFLDDSAGSIAAVKRALEVTNDPGEVARVVHGSGADGLANLDLEVFRPIKPMLAQQGEDLETAMDDLGDTDGRVLLEAKYDGVRAKLHDDGDQLRLYSRRLADITPQFPDVVRSAETGIQATAVILEAELVGVDPDSGAPVPFQELSRRVTRKHDIERLATEIPVDVHVFDLLHLNGETFLDRPLHERLAALDSVLEANLADFGRAEHLVTASLEEARSFRANALEGGHEGVMVKNLEATYEPGSRVGYQQKIKKTLDPLDLVVTRAKWSEGRKSEFLGRPYLACRDASGELREVGRMHTGFTDAQLEEFTALVEPLIQEIDGREARFRPEVVLEVECAEIQQSPNYDSGYALRFPRLLRIRHDLDVADVDTVERIEAMYRGDD